MVSWNDAAEIKLSVDNDALVIPSRQRFGHRGFAILADDPLVFIFETPLLDLVTNQEIGIADIFNAHAAQHLAYDDFDMLVVDAHTLETINLLHFVDEILGQGLFTENIENIVRDWTTRPSTPSPARIRSPSWTLICLPLGMKYSRGSPTSGVTTTFRLPFGIFTE